MFTPWSVGLCVAVTAIAAALAYLHAPRLKALVYTLPVPFFFARHDSGKPVDATYVLGMFSTLAFLWLTLLAYRRLRWPIVAAEAVGIAAFLSLGFAIGWSVPDTALAFWLALAVALPALIVLRVTLKPIYEPGHRTALPWYVKVPIILAIVVTVIVAKEPLRGFMPTFPFVGTFAVYESRHSLRTLIRQFVRFCIGFMGLLTTMRLLQPVIPQSWLWLRIVCGIGVGAGVYLIATGGRLLLPEVTEPLSDEAEPSPAGDPTGG